MGTRSISLCSVITIPERFPRRVQQRETASTAVLRTHPRFKRRLSCDLSVGTCQPLLKSARSAVFDGRRTIEDPRLDYRTSSSATCLEARATPSGTRFFAVPGDHEAAPVPTMDTHQYSEMDVDLIDAAEGSSDLNAAL